MIKDHAQPGGGGMTDVTGLGGWNMRRRQAGGDDAVMTGHTGAVHFRMIHQRIHWRPSRRCMAGVAIIRGSYVARRFSRGGKTIMTTNAGALYLIVIGCYRRHPNRTVVAGFANV